MDYESRNHAKFSLMVHVIFVCKYRKPLLIRLGKEVKIIMCNIANEYDFRIETLEVDKDHIHLLIRYLPEQSILWLVRTLKQLSTFLVWQLVEHNDWLRMHFWKERTFWSDGYFACSTGDASAETIANYIKKQG